MAKWFAICVWPGGRDPAVLAGWAEWSHQDHIDYVQKESSETDFLQVQFSVKLETLEVNNTNTALQQTL